MASNIPDSEKYLRDRIKHLWSNLSDEEIGFYHTMRDLFFMALRKKYSITRAEAQEVIRTLAHSYYEDAA